MSQQVRVRFAPSPTGPLHIGGVRTALFNYLYAKKHNGTFVLRIEDTDQNRYVSGAEDYIIDSLNWCGIPFDEGPGKEGDFGPYRQSERKDQYAAFAKALLDSGHAYYAFDTAEQLDARRKDQEAQGKTFIYNWHNRLALENGLALPETEVQQRLASGVPYVIRFKSPQDEKIVLQDEIRGTIYIDTNTLDDKVLFKSDGMPTYHLANIVDDHLMQITHVIRGEEWLPSLPLHYLLYKAFGWEAPKFAHLPLIMKPVGKGKLSKRDGAKGGFPVFPLEWIDPKNNEVSAGYREEGYLSEAVVNMLAFLGWNPGTEQEIFSLDQLIDAFDLDRVHKAGAKFDPEKTKWFQQHYFQEKETTTIAKDFQKLLQTKDIPTTDDFALRITTLLKERAVFTKDLWDASHYFFQAPTSYNEKAAKKAWKEDTAALMTKVMSVIEGIDTFEAASVQSTVKAWITSQELGFGKIMQPLRLSLVGAMQGPDVFEIAALLGKQETLSRIQNAIDTL